MLNSSRNNMRTMIKHIFRVVTLIISSTLFAFSQPIIDDVVSLCVGQSVDYDVRLNLPTSQYFVTVGWNKSGCATVTQTRLDNSPNQEYIENGPMRFTFSAAGTYYLSKYF